MHKSNNLPILKAIDVAKSRNVLGFYIWNSGKTCEKKLLDKLAYFFGKRTDELVRDMLIENQLWENVVSVNANGTAPTLKKSVTANDREAMFESGFEQAEAWFENKHKFKK